MLHIRPEAHCAEKSSHIPLYFHTLSLHFFNKGLQAVLLDLLLAVDAQQLFYFHSTGRPWVSQPALRGPDSPSWCGSGDHVLDNTGQHMADMGFSVSGGRPS